MQPPLSLKFEPNVGVANHVWQIWFLYFLLREEVWPVWGGGPEEAQGGPQIDELVLNVWEVIILLSGLSLFFFF